ncbi:MAG: aminopeptidase P family protein [Bacteroidales bacterium]|jgi:Xaa-Pro aminopeptidase|nr:aminopeptidase P family protein [Bacteroidales bacterium]
MFSKETYIARRNQLKKDLKSGIVLFAGNNDAPFNYPNNTYKFRQDSNFLYFFGLNKAGYFGVIDIDNDKDYIFANDIDMDDIIWMGYLPTVSDLATTIGVENVQPLHELPVFLKDAIDKRRSIHFTKPYRADITITLSELLGLKLNAVNDYASEELALAIIAQRSVKSKEEIAEIEKAMLIAYEMQTTAMKMAKDDSLFEHHIAGKVEGITLEHDGNVSFPVICSQDGQTLHNHHHANKLEKGRLLLLDCGAELPNNYCSDTTRTFPVGGKFTKKQAEIYQIVLDANMKAIEMARPGILYKDVHIAACEVIAEGLTRLGLMKGNPKKAVEAGAHALFMVHGLGHFMGLDVHDMENLGEKLVGYDKTVERSNKFGLAFLRFARELKPGFVITDEPGIYFIPQLIEQWENEGKFTQFINYNKVKEYLDFGGIRIEDDLLITETGCRVLGKPIPKTIDEIEQWMA